MGFRRPEEPSVDIAAELIKTLVLSFAACYSDDELQRMLSHDEEANPGYWWAGYWHFLDPLMQGFLGKDYLLWDSVDQLSILEVLEVFLKDYCEVESVK